MGTKSIKKRLQLLWCLGLLVPLIFTACGAKLSEGQGGAARARVEAEMQHARVIGVPITILNGFAAQVQHIDDARGWFGINDQVAATRYQQLTQQVQQGESDATASAENTASTDLSNLYNAVLRGTGSAVVPASFQVRWQGWQTAFATASTPADFTTLDQHIQADLHTIAAMTTTNDNLQQFGATVAAMRHAGLPVALEEAEWQQAQQTYAQGTTADDFTRLDAILNAESVGLITNETQAIPYLGGALLSDMQSRISMAQHYGETVDTFQSALATDQQSLTNAHSLIDYLDLKTQVSDQENTLNTLLIRGQTQQDLDQLRALLVYCQQHQMMDYEYASDTGLQGALSDFAASQNAQDYQNVDNEVTTLLFNLRAMITNIADATPYNQPHSTDLDLARYYGVAQGKVIVVSLREQTLRTYDNGQLIYAISITSGRPELPSPPGFWHVLAQVSPIVFTSGEDPSSPFYYAPTLVHYALLFHQGGYYLHDAWWRVRFGPGSNLPHPDPEAFNGGSHGCVNLPLQPMGLLYHWATLGTPVIVY